MIIITGSARFSAEKLDEAVALAIAHSARSRSEPGCIAHNCHIDAEDPQRIVFVEQWQDMTAVKAHFAVPESGAFVRALTGLAEGPPEMQIYRANAVQA